MRIDGIQSMHEIDVWDFLHWEKPGDLLEDDKHDFLSARGEV